MVDATTSLQLILGELTKIKTKIEQVAPSKVNTALDDQSKRREELRKRTDDRKNGTSSVMQKLLDATLGRGVSTNLTSNETVRFQNIAKTFNKVLKVDSISKSINQLREANQEAAEQQQRKSLFGGVTDKIKPVLTQSDTSKGTKVDGSGWLKMAAIGAGLGILGSIFAGKVDLGPFQGTVQLLTKWLTVGSIKGLFFGMEKFFKVLTAPLQMLSKFFSKESVEVASKAGGKIGTTFFQRLMPKLLKNISLKALSKIPLGIGAVVSFYFAYERFKRGDYIGALMDVGSGIASFVPVYGTAISVGIDILSAIRDATKEGEENVNQPKERGWFQRSMDGVIGWIGSNYYDLPVIGPAVRAYEHFQNNNYKEAFTSLLHILPGAGLLLDLVDVSETSSRTGVEVPKYGLVGKLLKYVNENCYDWPVFGPMIRAVEHLSNGNILEGLISMSHVVPWFGAIADLMNIKETHTRGEQKTLTPRTFDGMVDYLTDVMLNLPVVGDMMRAFHHFADGDYAAGFELILPKSVMSAYKKIQSKFITPFAPSDVDIKTPTTKSDTISNKLESDTFKQPQQSTESTKFEVTGLTDLQTTISKISQQELQLLVEQRQILSDNRSLLQVIAQSIQNLSPTQISNNVKPTFIEELSNTRSTYLDSINRMATALR